MYLRNGQRSDAGLYAYGVAPSGETARVEEPDGKLFARFADGALMDGQAGDDLGRGIEYPTTALASEDRFVFLDLGETVHLDSLTVRSRLDPGANLSVFQVAFSVDGTAFGDMLLNNSGWKGSFPHDPDLAVDAEVLVQGLAARYIRFRFFALPYNTVQIDEIDVTAHTPAGAGSGPEPDMDAFRELVRRHMDTPIIDEFGQWTRDDWPEKIRSEAELLSRHRADENRYPDAPADTERYDRFGGAKTLGIRRQPGEKFRVEKVDGRWWFITPDGYPFVVIGMDGVDVHDEQQMDSVAHPEIPNIAGRFEWVPDEDDERFPDCWLEPEPGIKRFNRFGANIIRRYGPDDYMDGFHKLASRRLRAWGFNTLGKWNWESPERVRRLDLRMPYVLVINSEFKEIPRFADLADPWHPDFEASVDRAVGDALNEHDCRDDPYYLGFTIGNEGWWNDDFTKTVLDGSSWDRPLKRALIDRTRDRHGHISSLNQACGSDWGSFDDLLAADLNPHAEALQEEISELIRESSDRFYGAWRKAADKHDPGRLVFGSSFVIWWHCKREWAEGSVRHCDVLMLDWYGTEPSGMIADYVEEFGVQYDKPVLNAEQGLTTILYGFRPTHAMVEDQEARGRWYRYSFEKFYAHPNWVGTMAYCYRPFSIAGRSLDGTGEAGQYGFVDICDLPYDDFIRHVAATNARLVDIHAGELSPITKEELGLE